MSRIQLFDYSVDLLKAILWQYNDAVNLQSLLQKKQDWYNENQRDFWANWKRDVFDLQTANEFGLSVWAIILDIPIVVQVEPPDPDIVRWGYDEFHMNYDNGNFAPGSGGVQVLTVEQARTVLRMRYFQITSRGTVPEINRFLKIILSQFAVSPILDPDTNQPITDPDTGLPITTPDENATPAYVVDNLNMTAEYVFLFPVPSKLRFIFESYDILPRPAGVSVTYSYP